MKKIKTTWKIEMIFLVLILASSLFVTGVDFDGDGIDDGEQNLCGDNFCQQEETIASCPVDCENPQQGILPSENEASFFFSLAFKIILIVVILIIIGVIIYLIIRKRNVPTINSEVNPQ